jgi:hypothetical protein
MIQMSDGQDYFTAGLWMKSIIFRAAPLTPIMGAFKPNAATDGFPIGWIFTVVYRHGIPFFIPTFPKNLPRRV